MPHSAPVALGTDGVEWDENCDEIHYCPNYFDQNIYTGAVLNAPARAPYVVDLNKPTLRRRACKPVKAPGLEGQIPPAESLTPVSSFLIAKPPNYRYTEYLERCGTHLHDAIHAAGIPSEGIGPAFYGKTILWQGSGTFLDGLILPKLHRFRIHLPALASFQLALGPHHLYALSSDQLWIASITPITHHRWK